MIFFKIFEKKINMSKKMLINETLGPNIILNGKIKNNKP